jgi:hypothetical protein
MGGSRLTDTRKDPSVMPEFLSQDPSKRPRYRYPFSGQSRQTIYRFRPIREHEPNRTRFFFRKYMQTTKNNFRFFSVKAIFPQGSAIYQDAHVTKVAKRVAITK